MHKYGNEFGEKVAEACIEKFQSLGKTGKPKEGTEWTLLACFLQEEPHKEIFEVVALGTGSKCIGVQQLPIEGDVLHDSHAEIIARRAFMVYLLDQVEKVLKNQISIFEQRDDKLRLKFGIRFHFYASHTPCGDASIIPKQEWGECCGQKEEVTQEETFVSIYKHVTEVDIPTRSNDDCTDIDNSEPPLKKLKVTEESQVKHETSNIDFIINSVDNIKQMPRIFSLTENNKEKDFHTGAYAENNIDKMDARPDIYRTGAKCLTGEKLDPKLPGSDYHVTGVLRTKPGRGDPTLSLSCSDKIFKWTVLGVQGALLMLFLETPVYVETITIGRCHYNQEAMERALFGRFKERLENIKLPVGFRILTPRILYADIDFPFSHSCITSCAGDAKKVMPSPTSLIWSVSSTHSSKHEVATNGRKLGTTKKNLGTPKSWVSICRRAIYLRVKALLQQHSKFMTSLVNLDDLSYGDLKCEARNYYIVWNDLKRNVLRNWTVKPGNIKNFRA